MGHPLRMYEPDRVYEITTRTIQGRFLLRPSEEANDLIVGIIGRAQQLYPAVRIHGVVYLSNHATWLLSSSVPSQIATFKGYINGNISSELGTLHDWPGKMWGRPHRPIPLMDETAMVDRFIYLLSQGCKEDLVDSPRDWPGATCVHALQGRRELRGTWFDRDAATKAGRRGHDDGPHAFATSYVVEFSKLPCWEHMSDEEYAARVEELIARIETDNRERRARDGRTVLGKRKVCRVDPHHRPDTVAKSPAPLCHASTARGRRAYRAIYSAFVAAYRAAAEALKLGGQRVEFPPWCYPPRRPFVVPG